MRPKRILIDRLSNNKAICIFLLKYIFHHFYVVFWAEKEEVNIAAKSTMELQALGKILKLKEVASTRKIDAYMVFREMFKRRYIP